MDVMDKFVQNHWECLWEGSTWGDCVVIPNIFKLVHGLSIANVFKYSVVVCGNTGVGELEEIQNEIEFDEEHLRSR
jgi:hypothetical protein